MADKLMYIPNNYTQNHSNYRLQLVVEMFEHELANQNSKKVYKVVRPTINNTLI